MLSTRCHNFVYIWARHHCCHVIEFWISLKGRRGTDLLRPCSLPRGDRANGNFRSPVSGDPVKKHVTSGSCAEMVNCAVGHSVPLLCLKPLLLESVSVVCDLI